MTEENKIVQDHNFDAELRRIERTGEFWVECVDDPVATLPPTCAGKKTTAVPFFAAVFARFAAMCAGSRTVYRADAAGKYTQPFQLGSVVYEPDATVNTAPTVGRRNPDLNVYYRDAGKRGPLSIVSSWELAARGRVDDTDFEDEDIGELIDTNIELLRQQPYRLFTIAVLSDGVRFAFFKVSRTGPQRDDFIVQRSTQYLNMRGWAIAFALLLQPPAYFGYKQLVMEGCQLLRVVGQGAHTYVFEVSNNDKPDEEETRTPKVFERPEEYRTEVDNLTRLAQILRHRAEYAHVPQLNNDSLKKVTDVVSGSVHCAILILPVCSHIRPRRGGRRLKKRHIAQLLDTLEAVHSGGMVNCDIKPANILLDGNDAVICDWGSAVFPGPDGTRPVHSVGTVGYCDFLLRKPVIPHPAHDLKALVRTVYANYCNELADSNQARADAFWAGCFADKSIWKKAIKCAENGNYVSLSKLFWKL